MTIELPPGHTHEDVNAVFDEVFIVDELNSLRRDRPIGTLKIILES